MNKTDACIGLSIYIATMLGLLYLANTLGETETRLNYICGEVQKLDLLVVDKEGVCNVSGG